MPIRIPEVAWSRALGEGYEPAPRPRVATPMVDDGPWGGVPIGGLGAGALGRTQRGDFARRHLRVGEHRFVPGGRGGVDGFAVWVSDGRRSEAVVLRTTEPPRGWGPPLAVGAGRYRAMFPRAWFEYELDGWPIRIVEEQLTPILPGDEASSSLPVGAFEVELENRGDRVLEVAVLFAFADPLDEAMGTGQPGEASRFALDGCSGVRFERVSGHGDRGSFAIAAAAGAVGDDVEVTTAPSFDPSDAAGVWAAFAADGRLPPGDGRAGGALPGESGDRAGAVSVRARLEPGETRALRFGIAWDVPIVQFGGGRRWWKRYTRECGRGGTGAASLAARAVGCLPDWRSAIETWQAPILGSSTRPDWYKAALFNELYFLVDGGTFWPDAPVDERGWKAPGAAIGFLESLDYLFYDTLDVHFYAAFALSSLWPRLESTISRAYAASVDLDDPSLVEVEATGELARRKVRGALPHDLGGPDEDPLVRVNRYTFQEVNGWKDLGPKFVLQAWRDRQWSDDPDAYVREVWPAVREAMAHVAAFDRDGDGLPEHDGQPDQTYDTWPMNGPSAYGGSLWLGALRAAAAFARTVGDEEAASGWDRTFGRGAASFEAKLWNGTSYDYDAGGGPTSDSVMADQLVGQWYADASGLGDLVPPDRVRSALARIHRLNVQGFEDGQRGAVNGMRPDGSVDESSEQSQEVWVGTSYALAAFMIGRGMVDEGWATAEGAARTVWERGLWFRTPEGYDRNGNFRASIYLRPVAIWAIEEALQRVGLDR